METCRLSLSSVSRSLLFLFEHGEVHISGLWWVKSQLQFTIARWVSVTPITQSPHSHENTASCYSFRHRSALCVSLSLSVPLLCNLFLCGLVCLLRSEILCFSSVHSHMTHNVSNTVNCSHNAACPMSCSVCFSVLPLPPCLYPWPWL